MLEKLRIRGHALENNSSGVILGNVGTFSERGIAGLRSTFGQNVDSLKLKIELYKSECEK